jgi:hypothetical protein
MGLAHSPRIVTDGLVLALDAANLKSYDSRIISGQQTYTSSGTYSWTCPSGVTSVSVVCIGGGGGGNGGGYGVGGAGGGGGGGLGYKNNIPVTPGQSYTVVVGGGGAGDYWSGPPYSTDPADSGGDSYFIDATTVKGGGGGGGNGNSGAAGGSGGTYVGDGGGNGYSGGTGSGSQTLPATGGGGGSTGTYTGNATTRGTSKYITSNCTSGCLAGSGTGQGLLGTGSSGLYGRGGGANMNTFSNGTSGYTGAVRIMWGTDRSYPSTGVADQSPPAFNDMSGNGNTGTLTNGPTYSSDGGGSIVIDGSDDLVSISDSSSIDVTPTVTISAWINPSGFGENNFGRIIDSGDSYNFFLDNSTVTSGIRYYPRVGNALSVANCVTLDEWANFVVVHSGSNLTIYKNGVSIGTSSGMSTLPSTSSGLTIGNSNVGDRAFRGKISQVLVYNKALTAAEVEQNFNALRSRYGI